MGFGGGKSSAAPPPLPPPPPPPPPPEAEPRDQAALDKARRAKQAQASDEERSPGLLALTGKEDEDGVFKTKKGSGTTLLGS